MGTRGRTRSALLLLGSLAAFACGGRDDGLPGRGAEAEAGTSAADGAAATAGAATNADADAATETATSRVRAGDSLVVVANLEEARLHLLPKDWSDLFHFRYAQRVIVLDPTTSPVTADFLEGVLVSEARRTGVADAGFDWLRRLDRAAVAYEQDPDDAAWRLRRGEAAFALLPASAAPALLAREGFDLVPMAAGSHPRRWGAADGSADAGDAPDPPADWLATWATEVRGKG